MDLDTRYEVRSPGVIAENFDGDIVVLNLDDGCYFSLEGAGSLIWNALVAGHSFRSILHSVPPRRRELWTATDRFLRRLHELRLVRTAEQGAAVSNAPPVDWDSVTDDDEPRVEVFDDLAELILADPIHDVDTEAGWPIRKAA